jgi:hypothetical protein
MLERKCQCGTCSSDCTRRKKARDYMKKYSAQPEANRKKCAYMKSFVQRPAERDRRAQRGKLRRRTDANYCLARILRARVSKLARGQKAGSAVRDLGCSVEELRAHLEARFAPGMTWENYGPKGWHIDHILPLAGFDLTDRQQFLRACHFSNLQPLWWRENLQKGAR